MLGKCVLLVLLLTISLTGIIGTQRYEDLKISVVTTNLDANAVADDDGLVILHRGRPDVKGIIHYTLGNRSGGDRLVASGAQNNTWPQPHNVAVELQYPQQGAGALVTYVEISVGQTSNTGRAYVTKGGINQRFITVAIEAYDTLAFNIVASIYGI